MCRFIFVFFFISLIATHSLIAWSLPFVLDNRALQRLIEDGHNSINYRIDNERQTIRFLRIEPQINNQNVVNKSATLAAEVFLDEYGSVFGLKSDADEFRLISSSTQNKKLVYQQYHHNVPVLGGMMNVHVNDNNEVVIINSKTYPVDDVSMNVGIDIEQASNKSLMYIAEYYNIPMNKLEASYDGLVVVNDGILKGKYGRNRLSYQFDITDHGAVHETVFVDAMSKNVVEHITHFHTAHEIIHTTYNGKSDYNNNNVFWMTGDAFPTTEQDANNLIPTTEQVYKFFHNYIGFYDWYHYGPGDMVSVFNDTETLSFCPNAGASTTTIYVCPDSAFDDLVTHEWTHIASYYYSPLYYSYQSGALDESYSDIIGEIIDLLNDVNTDTNINLRSDSDCYTGNEDSIRWLVLEDLSSLGDPYYRDMWNPNCAGLPGKVSDSEYYCSGGDSGGVHYNSSIPNHGFALLTDGGTYNGETISSIGMSKAIYIYWRALDLYMLSTSDFVDHADSLEQACLDLVDTYVRPISLDPIELDTISTGSFEISDLGELITTQDCDQVTKMISAVELRETPSC